LKRRLELIVRDSSQSGNAGINSGMDLRIGSRHETNLLDFIWHAKYYDSVTSSTPKDQVSCPICPDRCDQAREGFQDKRRSVT
jgi:hypothetical protein